MVNSKLTVYGSETVACHPARAEWRQTCIAPAGNFSEGGDTYDSLSKIPDGLFAKLSAKLQNIYL